MTTDSKKPYGWRGTIHDLLLAKKEEWRTALEQHHAARKGSPADKPQSEKWDAMFATLTKEFTQLLQVKPELEHYIIIFDYEVPTGSVRGPDIVILGSSVFVLEFADCEEVIQAYVDAAAAYAVDVVQYRHTPCTADIIPVLVCARAKDMIRRFGDVVVLSPNHIGDFFNVHSELETELPIDPDEWLAGAV